MTNSDRDTTRGGLLFAHWRLILHLLFGTRRFGVNGRWRAGFDSVFHRPFFGFGYRILVQPWRWPALAGILRLRSEIAGWRRPW